MLWTDAMYNHDLQKILKPDEQLNKPTEQLKVSEEKLNLSGREVKLPPGPCLACLTQKLVYLILRHAILRPEDNKR